MRTEKQRIEENRDLWQHSAIFDKRQALASFVLAGCGIVGATGGTLLIIDGEPLSGVPGLVVGTGMLIAGYRDARREIESAMENQGKVAIRQHEIDTLEESDNT